MSAFGGKADIILGVAKSPLIANNGHYNTFGFLRIDPTKRLQDLNRRRMRIFLTLSVTVSSQLGSPSLASIIASLFV